MALYTAENLLLSVPSLFTFSRHILRHTIVPPLDIEMSVIVMSYVLIFLIPGYKYLTVQNPILSSNCNISGLFCLIGFSEYKLFILYNLHGHPWSRLLQEPDPEPEVAEEMLLKEIKTETDSNTVIVPHVI